LATRHAEARQLVGNRPGRVHGGSSPCGGSSGAMLRDRRFCKTTITEFERSGLMQEEFATRRGVSVGTLRVWIATAARPGADSRAPSTDEERRGRERVLLKCKYSEGERGLEHQGCELRPVTLNQRNRRSQATGGSPASRFEAVVLATSTSMPVTAVVTLPTPTWAPGFAIEASRFEGVVLTMSTWAPGYDRTGHVSRSDVGAIKPSGYEHGVHGLREHAVHQRRQHNLAGRQPTWGAAGHGRTCRAGRGHVGARDEGRHVGRPHVGPRLCSKLSCWTCTRGLPQRSRPSWPGSRGRPGRRATSRLHRAAARSPPDCR